MTGPANERRPERRPGAAKSFGGDITSLEHLGQRAEDQRRAQLVLDLRRVADRHRRRDPELSALAQGLVEALVGVDKTTGVDHCCGVLDLEQALAAGRAQMFCSPTSCVRRSGVVS